MLIIISACVLHNFFCLIYDDFDEGYCGDLDDNDDDDDGGHGLAHPLLKRTQQKGMHIMGMLH